MEGAPSPADFADAVIAEWREARRDVADGRSSRSDRLIEAYRALARAALRPAFEDAAVSTGDGGTHGGHADEGRAEGLIPRLAMAARTSGLSMAEVLEDLADLSPALSRALDADETGLSTKDVVATFDHRMATNVVRSVEMLEAASLRDRREHEESLATMTEVLSHELKNRLGAARTAADVLIHPDLEIDRDTIRRGAELVRQSIDDALRTVEDVRALAARQANLSEPRHQVMRLPELVGVLVEEVRVNAEKAGVNLEVGEIPEVRVDAARMRLVLGNLLQNGVKYRAPSASHAYVRVSARRSDHDHVVLRVADNGVGISREDLEDIFLPRFRGGAAGDVSGSGLGLAIVEEAVVQVDGRISVESEPGVGTEFTVSFPVAPTEPR